MLRIRNYRWSSVLGIVLVFAFGALLLGSVTPERAFAAAAGLDQTQFMSVAELREGMVGTAKTVFHGTKIEDFEVEILSVMPESGTSGDMILARVSQEVIERTGGVVQGMSGSPVYVDGKLIGAISGAYRNNPDGLAVITPIHSMLTVLERVKRSGGELQLKGEAWAPLATPIMASGLSHRAMDTLADATRPWGMYPVESGRLWPGAMGSATDVELEPGAALGMQWVRGDVNLTSVGTVTHVDGEEFIAFGHTAGSWGDINAFASTAYVNAIVKSTDIGFKLASPLETVGTISQDRFAAVGGTIGKLPPVVTYDVRVNDKDSNKEYEYQFEVVRSEQFTNRFSASALLGVLDRAIDRLGPGTSRVIYRIFGKDMEPVVRDNLYYSAIDIAAVSLSELLEATDLLLRNEFKAVEVERVQLEVEVDSSRQTAVIERARPMRHAVAPGESLNVEVVIRPYRGKRETKIVRLDIPEYVQPGTVHVTVRGGGSGYLFAEKTPYHEELDDKSEEKTDGTQPPSNAESLDKLIKDLGQRPRHQDLVVEFVPYLDPYDPAEQAIPAMGEVEDSPDASDGTNVLGRSGSRYASTTDENIPPTASDGWNGKQPDPIRSVLATQYYLEGEIGFELNILSVQESDSSTGATDVSEDDSDATTAGDQQSKDDSQQTGDEGEEPNAEASENSTQPEAPEEN